MTEIKTKQSSHQQKVRKTETKQRRERFERPVIDCELQVKGQQGPSDTEEPRLDPNVCRFHKQGGPNILG